MATFAADFYPSLRSQLAGATQGAVLEGFRYAARQFYMQTRAWRAKSEPIDIVEGEDEVILQPIILTDIGEVDLCYFERAWWYNEPMRPRADSYSRVNIYPKVGRPGRISTDGTSKVILYPTPDQDYDASLIVEVSLQPKGDCSILPDDAFTHHFQALECGTLAKMHKQRNRPYYDPAEALKQERTFLSYIARMRSNARRGNMEAEIPFTFPVVSQT